MTDRQTHALWKCNTSVWSLLSFDVTTIGLFFNSYFPAIKWAYSSLLWICTDFWRILWVYFSWDSSRPAADSARVRCGPKNLRWIRRGSATSLRQSCGLFGLKKPKKSASLPKESESVCCELFSILADQIRVRARAKVWSRVRVRLTRRLVNLALALTLALSPNQNP